MKILGGYFYVDRPLTLRERVSVKVFRRRDPRLLGHITQTGGTVNFWLDDEVLRVQGDQQ